MSTHIISFAVPATVAATLLAVVAGPMVARANPRAEALLAQLPFSEGERKRILAGELVTTASREKTSDRELAITMAFLISKPPPDLAAMFQKASAYQTDKTATAHGEFRGDGSLADLQALRLAPNGDREARRFAEAKAGDDLNLCSPRKLRRSSPRCSTTRSRSRRRPRRSSSG